MDVLTITFLTLAVIGAIGSAPVIITGWKWLKYDGIRIDGKWTCRWQDKRGNEYTNETIIKQRGSRIRMYALNEWQDYFEGELAEGGLIEGRWRSMKPGVHNRGVFMLKLKGTSTPEIEGHFLGLDDEGNRIEFMRGRLIKQDIGPLTK